MNKEKALKNQGLEFREDIVFDRGAWFYRIPGMWCCKHITNTGLFITPRCILESTLRILLIPDNLKYVFSHNFF